ncbi:hypothetical protein PBY51_002067 [Eleginops maclovinus]|uniref:Uncharacterized protein n=1 Tax=Eleginops maclovinus TaxID=56733 RepID=A0AAN8A1A3_ELEMC|nr:hypothetical protein PBY51_002067 [Eleginops maclovinus]
MSLFSGRAETWLGAPLHFSVLSPQAEHPRPKTRSTHTLRHGRAGKKEITPELWGRQEKKQQPKSEYGRKKSF